MRSFFAVAATTALLATRLPAVDIELPTENHFLLSGEPEKFYMYVDRTFEGETTKPWEGGGFGFVRTPQRIGGEVVLTKFHEGIDISPIRRDKAGNPLDLVQSISEGTVVHISELAGRSNYGKYVVVEHRFDGDVFYSLYAHLSKIAVKPGDPVKKGSVLGQMGYTGDGFYGSNIRAHCHLEICLMGSSHYDGWHKAYSGGVNYQGLFNGMNLIGIDVARLFLENQANPATRVQDFIRNTPPYFKVTLPRKGALDFVERNKWLLHPDTLADSPSWEISFTATGLPVGITSSLKAVTEPTVTAVRDSKIAHRFLTRGLIDGQGSTARLMKGGKNLLALITDDFPHEAAAASGAKAPGQGAAGAPKEDE